MYDEMSIEELDAEKTRINGQMDELKAKVREINGVMNAKLFDRRVEEALAALPEDVRNAVVSVGASAGAGGEARGVKPSL